MKVAEVFYSVQGEGMLAGVPTVFVRTSGCNLRCVWCDTPYTSWQPEGATHSVAEVADKVIRYNARHVVVTGGEPMLLDETVALTEQLSQAGLHITIETAGTLDKPVVCDLMSISPKLAHSTPWEREQGRWAAQHERLRWQPAVVRALMDRYQYQLKFVLAQPEDVPEIQAMVAEVGATPDRVVLMAEGTWPETIRSRAEWIIELCKQHGFRYSPRLHVDVWGDRRGV